MFAMFAEVMDKKSGVNNWHCDDILDGKSATKYPQCVLDFLAVARSPAHGYSVGGKLPELYADIVIKNKVERVKIVMASRFGDVGITTNMKAEYGYDARVFLEELNSFSDKPDLPLTQAELAKASVKAKRLKNKENGNGNRRRRFYRNRRSG